MKKSSTSAEDLVPPEQKFPSARYFQIHFHFHFQYLQEIIADLHLQMENANQQIAELQRQLQLNHAVNDTPPHDFGKKPEGCLERG
ncbi:hypothetical protein [Methylomicrobium lacus]|uniref:hypothetical protein n=1 Tax=Methylomicrobium lacus TaxID=136992 RepID=UPI00045E6D31|nr:hypothetical protein [Methylomicrobium lacus]